MPLRLGSPGNEGGEVRADVRQVRRQPKQPTVAERFHVETALPQRRDVGPLRELLTPVGPPGKLRDLALVQLPVEDAQTEVALRTAAPHRVVLRFQMREPMEHCKNRSAEFATLSEEPPPIDSCRRSKIAYDSPRQEFVERAAAPSVFYTPQCPDRMRSAPPKLFETIPPEVAHPVFDWAGP